MVLRETLRDMGHQVWCFSDFSGLKQYKHSLVHRAYRKLTGRLREADRRRHIALLKNDVASCKPGLVIILKGLHVAGADIAEIKAVGAWVCIINHDDFFSANPNNWSTLQRHAIPAYNFIFTTRESTWLRSGLSIRT